MNSESKSHAGLPSHGEARAIVDRARRLRAETLARLTRATLGRLGLGSARVLPAARFGRNPAAIGLPHARA